MVSRDIHKDLLSFGLPVIFVGDHGQLPPVGSDINLMESPRYRLETIHRSAGPIAHFAEHLRTGNSSRSFEGCAGVRLVEPDEVSDDLLLDSGQVLCVFNKTRCDVNCRVRRLLDRRGEVEPGDRVVCLRNHREAGLFNGMQGKVLAVQPGSTPALDFRAGGVLFERLPYDPNVFGQERPAISFHPDAPHPFDFSYCITTHKSQGSEWKRVLVLEQRCRHWEHARWAYTAASRARERLTWVCEARARPTSWPEMAAAGRRHGRGAHHESSCFFPYVKEKVVSFPPIRVVDLDLAGDGYGTIYALSFPYDPELVAILRGALQDARRGRSRPAGSWDPDNRCWRVEEFAWDEVSSTLRRAGCTLLEPDGQILEEPEEEKPPFKLSSFKGLP